MAGDGVELLSRRVAGALLGREESWIRRMFEAGAELRRDGNGPVHDLSLGNPSLEPPEVWKTAVRELLEGEPPGLHRYMTNAGFAEVRAFVAARESARYGLPFEAGDVVMTVGAAGAINVLFRVLLDPGDEVVVPAPYFTEYTHYCAHVGAVLRPVATADGFALDPERVVAAIGERTRGVLLNSPNNPTGAVYGAEELRALAEALGRINEGRARPIVVIEDSPYRDLTHDGSAVAAMLEVYPHTIFVTSHSKDLGLAGERIGYLVISPRCLGRGVVARGAAYANRVLGFVNAPALMQRVLPRVLGSADGRVDVEVYARRCRVMAAGLRELGFSLPEPRAGFFLFPGLPERLRGADGGDVALTERLLAERTVVVPGTAFGAAGFLRLSMATEDAAVDGALEAFRKVCG